MRNRNNQIILRLNDSELNMLNQKVAASGLSRERYIRKVLAEEPIPMALPVDFKTLIREMNRIGSNIEQILRIANTKRLVDVPRLRQSLDELDSLEKTMWQVFMPGS